MSQRKIDLSELAKTLPPLIVRKDIDRYLQGYLTGAYLANLDSKGKGPVVTKMGRRVAYLREDLIAWLESRTQR